MKKAIFILGIIAGINLNAQNWETTGNAGTNPSTDFIGTTDNNSLVFKTNNIEQFRILPDGSFKVQGLLSQGAVWSKNLYFGGGNSLNNTSNHHNTVFGIGSFTFSSSGGANTAFGGNTLATITSSSGNTAIGMNALRLSASGDYNTAIGGGSMGLNGIFIENTAVGTASLERNNATSTEIASYNSALGSRSLAYLKSGEKNVAVGYNSMRALNFGNKNIAIGSFSGLSLVNGNGNILIGDTANSTSSTSNNELNIGNWIVGHNGTIGIGTFTNPLPADGIAQDGEKYKLFVKDGIKTEKVKVDIAASNGWADYVFKKDYKLMPLKDLEKFINTNGHLPEVPTTEEAIANGIELKSMNILLLKKVEELTLHAINQQKVIDQQNIRLDALEKINK